MYTLYFDISPNRKYASNQKANTRMVHILAWILFKKKRKIKTLKQIGNIK